jgi:hypothetical protein
MRTLRSSVPRLVIAAAMAALGTAAAKAPGSSPTRGGALSIP